MAKLFFNKNLGVQIKVNCSNGGRLSQNAVMYMGNIGRTAHELFGIPYERNTYFCFKCNLYFYDVKRPPILENSFYTCSNCGTNVFIPPNVELIDDWQIWFPYFQNIKLYHTTDISNTESIKKFGGLYSWKYLEDNNIPVQKPGGNKLSRNLDSNKKLSNYVRLSFSKNTPMNFIAIKEGRIPNPIYYIVNPLVILLKGNKFSNINATDNDAIIGEGIKNFFNINLDIASSERFSTEKEKKLLQAEILVETHVPYGLLNEVVGVNQYSNLPF